MQVFRPTLIAGSLVTGGAAAYGLSQPDRLRKDDTSDGWHDEPPEGRILSHMPSAKSWLIGAGLGAAGALAPTPLFADGICDGVPVAKRAAVRAGMIGSIALSGAYLLAKSRDTEAGLPEADAWIKVGKEKARPIQIDSAPIADAGRSTWELMEDLGPGEGIVKSHNADGTQTLHRTHLPAGTPPLDLGDVDDRYIELVDTRADDSRFFTWLDVKTADGATHHINNEEYDRYRQDNDMESTPALTLLANLR